jgi:hypothetical protein
MPRARLIHQTPIFSPDEILGLVPLSPCALIMYLWIQTIAIEDGVREVDLQRQMDTPCPE